MTSSAVASSVGGISMPSAFAVLRLIDQFELGRLLDRQIRRLGALQDAIDIGGRAPVQVHDIDPIRHQPAIGSPEPPGKYRRHAVGRGL